MRQTQKNLVLLAVLAAGSVGLGLLAWYGVKEPDAREAERKAADEQLFATRAPGESTADGGAAQAARFTRVTVTAKGDTTTLERRGEKWWVTSPVEARADDIAAGGVSSRLDSARFKSVIEEAPSPEDLKRYGLAPPQFSVKAVATLPGGGEKVVTLEGGIENPYDGSVYVRREGDPRVFSVEGGVRWALEKSTFELRDKEVLTFTEPTLKAVEVRTKANAWRLEKGEKKQWRQTQGKAFEADTQALASMLTDLKAARATSFPKDSPEERKKLGLEKPLVEATFTPESGEPVRVRIAQSEVDGVQRTWALREEGGKAVLAEVGHAAVGALDKPLSELRDRTALRFERDHVARLVFTPEGGGEAIVLERTQAADAGTSEEWRVTAPQAGAAKKYKVSSLLWSLGALRALSLGEESPRSWERYGVGPKAKSVALYGAGGEELARLTLGREVPDRTDAVYARGSRNQVLEVEPSRLNEWPDAVGDLLEAAGGAASDGGAAAAAPP